MVIASAFPARLLTDLNYFGYLFEALVVRDLRVFADAVDGTVQHYRDSDDLEIDAVVTAGDGRWAAFEVKLGQDDIDFAAANLLALGGKVDTTKVGEPATLAVITATGYGSTPSDNDPAHNAGLATGLCDAASGPRCCGRLSCLDGLRRADIGCSHAQPL